MIMKALTTIYAHIIIIKYIEVSVVYMSSLVSLSVCHMFVSVTYLQNTWFDSRFIHITVHLC